MEHKDYVINEPIELTTLELGQIYKIKGELWAIATLDLAAITYANENAFELKLVLVSPQSHIIPNPKKKSWLKGLFIVVIFLLTLAARGQTNLMATNNLIGSHSATSSSVAMSRMWRGR